MAALQERAQQAAYAHIPLGNMGPDWMLAAADALFGRCLRDAKHLLWARDASLPALSQLPTLAEEDGAQLEPPAMDVRFWERCVSCHCISKWLPSLAGEDEAQLEPPAMDVRFLEAGFVP